MLDPPEHFVADGDGSVPPPSDPAASEIGSGEAGHPNRSTPTGPSESAEVDQRDRPGEFAELLNAAQSGSEVAIARLVHRHRGALWRLAYRESTAALRTKISPSDLVQETYAEAHVKLAQFQGRSEHEFVAWLNSILRSKLAKGRRRYLFTDKRSLDREAHLAATSDEHLLAMIAESAPTPGSRAANKELAALMRAAIARLPDDYQIAIVMRNWQGRTFAEIAKELRRSEEAARKLWVRAIDRLAAELDGGDGNECES